MGGVAIPYSCTNFGLNSNALFPVFGEFADGFFEKLGEFGLDLRAGGKGGTRFLGAGGMGIILWALTVFILPLTVIMFCGWGFVLGGILTGGVFITAVEGGT